MRRASLGHVFCRIEAFYFTGNRGRKSGCIKLGYLSNAAFAGQDALPVLGEIETDGRDNAHSGDDHTSFAQAATLVNVWRRVGRKWPLVKTRAAGTRWLAALAVWDTGYFWCALT